MTPQKFWDFPPPNNLASAPTQPRPPPQLYDRRFFNSSSTNEGLDVINSHSSLAPTAAASGGCLRACVGPSAGLWVMAGGGDVSPTPPSPLPREPLGHKWPHPAVPLGHPRERKALGGERRGGHPKTPPSPIFVRGVRVSHGATRCHQEPAVRSALGPGAAAETWSTPGSWSTPGAWRTPRTWSTLQHPQIWSTLEHLKTWNTHGSQSTLGSAVAGGTWSTSGARAPWALEHPWDMEHPWELEHPPGACRVLEQPVGPGPAAQGQGCPTQAPSLRKGLGAPAGLLLPTRPAKTPPQSPQLHSSLPLASGTHPPGVVPAPITTK